VSLGELTCYNHVSSKTASIIEDIAVDFDTPIIDEIYMSSGSASDDVDEIVEPNIPTMLSKPFKSVCAEYSFMVVLIASSFRESPEFLLRSSRWFLVLYLFLVVWSLCLSLMYVHLRGYMCVLLGMSILPSLGVMPRVPTTLHLFVAYIDDIIRPIAICIDTHKFATYPYSTL